ncbi:hypothetical protein CSQ96_22395 [Janthinobacterium sp. BJB412]|nr:hypothetical protein CSQ96_22395 [Janthinobacterium sp. BJB412]
MNRATLGKHVLYIFIDESGTFTNAIDADSWCVVAAFVLPESQLVKLEQLVVELQTEHAGVAEVKLGDMTEARYIRFLKDLSRLGGLAFAVAVDVSLHPKNEVVAHRNAQAEKVIEHREIMMHASGRAALTKLSEAIQSLPVQLYTQMQCQVELFHRILCRAPVYFSQHAPSTLEFYHWRIDQKDTIPTAYERAFKMILPAVLQSKSLRDPMIVLVEGDYSFHKRFEFEAGEYPTYLREQYGIETSGKGANLKLMVTEDFQLVDSKTVAGVQAADLLSSGIRRLLRGGFQRSHEVALLLGANMLSVLKNESQVQLISLAQTAQVSVKTARTLETMARTSKPLV